MIPQPLPFSGITPPSRHASYLGAQDASGRSQPQAERYLKLLRERGPQTDWEAAKALGLERTSITARRAPLVRAGLVVPDGFRPGPTGKIRNCVWALASETTEV